MKITLVVLFLAGLTIYCKCATVLSLPPSFIAHAASLDDNLKTEKPSANKDNELQPQLPTPEDKEASNEPTLAGDLYTNFKNLWHNDLSLNLQKREERNTFDDDDIDQVEAMQKQRQQTIATIKENNKNQNGLQPHDSDNDNDNNVGHKNYNHNNNKNENSILKSSTASSSSPLPLLHSSAATNMNEATNLNLNTQPQLQIPLQKIALAEDYDDTNEWLSSSPEMIDDIFVSPPHQIKEPLHLKRRELENMPLAAAAASAATEESPVLNRFLKSTKYWSRQCPLENENNCLQEYYGALIADRNNALLKQLQYRENHPFAKADEKSTSQTYNNNNINDDDIFLLLTAEQNLMKLLSWALAELYPYGKFANVTDNDAEYYHPGMYMWKKLNLSGRLEPPLLVEEPHYVIVRREYDQTDDDNDENEYKRGLNYGGDPFIPPRGRKHNLPDLDSLLHRYETFVPNRGRRDKIRDIFKNDDLFYPNRGKRQMTSAFNDNGDTDERNDDNDIENIEDIKENQAAYYNNEENGERHEMQHPLLSNELIQYIENLMAKMKRKLHRPKQQQKIQEEKLANSFDEMSNRYEPTTRMSTTFQQAPPAATSASPSLLKKRFKSMINILHNRKKPQQQHLPNHLNARRQWWKRYQSAKTSLTQPTNSNDRAMQAIRSPTMATTNRLQKTLRSMSPSQQLTQLYQQQLPDLSLPYIKSDNKFMWQQQQNSLKALAQQFDPLSWHKLQLLLKQQQLLQQQYRHRHHQPLLTMRHSRLTALQHLPAMQQPQQQQQLATPQETQLTYASDQLDNGITNDLDNFYNRDLD